MRHSIDGIEVDGRLEQCNVDRRVECDQGNEDCLAAGCCWNPVDDPIHPNIPWCFQTNESNNNQFTFFIHSNRHKLLK